MTETGIINVPMLGGEGKRNGPAALILALFYIAGAFWGCFFGRTVFNIYPSDIRTPHFIAYLWHDLYPWVLAVAFSTSSVGWVLLPIVFIAKGFSLTCSFLYFFLYGYGSGFILALFTVSAVFALTALIAVGMESMKASLALFRMRNGVPVADGNDGGSGYVVLLSLLLILSSSFIRYYFLTPLF